MLPNVNKLVNSYHFFFTAHAKYVKVMFKTSTKTKPGDFSAVTKLDTRSLEVTKISHWLISGHVFTTPHPKKVTKNCQERDISFQTLTHSANGPWKKKVWILFSLLNNVIPKSLKFSHWPSKLKKTRERFPCHSTHGPTLHNLPRQTRSSLLRVFPRWCRPSIGNMRKWSVLGMITGPST